MASARFRPVLHYLRTLALRPRPEERSDGFLLERFAAERDESAFAVLVHRHGPMVLAVCRRVLHDAHDAEDCFQAVFLVLARKAASLRDPERLGNWLHGVAHRIAVKSRARAIRHRKHECPLVDLPAPLRDDVGWRDARPILDEEIHRLPVKYRTAVILCYLEGATNAEAALQLGWTRGTVATRLAWARQRLRLRLVRRGITLSVGVLTVLCTSEITRAAVPGALADATIKTAVSFITGATLAAGTTPALALAKGVLKTMTMTKIQFAALMLLTASAVGVGVGWLARSVPFGDRPEAHPQAVIPPAPPQQGVEPNAGLKQEIATLRKEMGDLKKQAVARPTPEVAVKPPEPVLYQGKPASYWLAALRDRDWNFRVKAVEPLGSLAIVDHSLIPAVIGCLQDDVDQVRLMAVNALGDIGPPAREAIVPLLRSRLSIESILYALEQIDPKGQRSIPAALEALKETEPRIRRTVAFVLLAFDPSKLRLGITGFIDALKEGDERVVNGNRLAKKGGGYNSVHQIAAWALGQIGPEAQEAVPLLVLRLRLPSLGAPPMAAGQSQRETTVPYGSALKRVDPKGKEAIPLLIKALMPKVSEDQNGAEEWRRQIDSGGCRRVILALAEYGAKAKAAVPILRVIIKNTEKNSTSPGALSELNHDAIEALKKIDPKESPDTEPNKPAKKSTEK